MPPEAAADAHKHNRTHPQMNSATDGAEDLELSLWLAAPWETVPSREVSLLSWFKVLWDEEPVGPDRFLWSSELPEAVQSCIIRPQTIQSRAKIMEITAAQVLRVGQEEQEGESSKKPE